MAVLVIRKLPPDTQPEAVAALLRELGFSHPIGEITISDDSGFPMALIELDISEAACHAVAKQMHGHFWNGHTLETSETHIWRE
ncbi:hypothetical protein IGB42_00646 [Andreprevotia sp. IGB-42]|uniref:hypothetical protein n=1 Tax=Andreprevotia sp. IGB-42 TaxID=2497473 RepID=UPI001358375B|nr:hypothetical protein [Andreprevotia sp. IGB-42]KAF0814592.1 hypothetical protein IGB42_00646 [Andreprevotia sp. IGB-42]